MIVQSPGLARDGRGLATRRKERGMAMQCRLEHANITVLDLDEAVRFLTTAFPHYKVRGGGEEDHGDWKMKWLHLGTDDTYIALMATDVAVPHERAVHQTTGINHVGFEVDDTDAVKGAIEAAGYKCSYALPHHPYRKRFYATDASGVTWEFIQYLSDDPAERNDYKL